MTPVRLRAPILRKLVIGCIALLFMGACIAYVGFQARFLIEGPQVHLTTDPEVVQNGRQIKVAGVANNITAIYLNGRPIVTTEDGVFEESVILENGYTTLRIEARDRFGRTVALKREYVYTGPGSIVYQ